MYFELVAIVYKDGLELVEKSELIIMHNPFEWFTKDGGRSIFDKLTQNFKESFQFLSRRLDRK